MLIDIGGTQLHFQEQGEAKKTLVLLHGLGMNCELWRSQVPVFSRYFRTIAVDLRGFGKSSAPKGPGAFKIDAMAKDIIELIKKLGISGCHLLGTSMGGFVAQSLAISEPTLCKSLVLSNTAPKMSIPKKILEERIEALSTLPLDEYGNLVAEQACSSKSPRELKEWVISMIKKNDRAIYQKVLIEGLSEFNVLPSLRKITLPTLVIVGEHDRVLPAEEGRKIGRLIKGSKVVEISSVGHLAYAEKPDTFNNLVLNFLKSI